MTCPVCDVEFSTPYVREAWRLCESLYCPRGHRLDFVPPLVTKPAEEQVEELERMLTL